MLAIRSSLRIALHPCGSPVSCGAHPRRLQQKHGRTQDQHYFCRCHRQPLAKYYPRYRSLARNVLMFGRSSTALTSCFNRGYCCSPFPPSCVRFSSCAIWYSTISAYVNVWPKMNGPTFEKSLLVKWACSPSRKRSRSPSWCLGYVSCWLGLRKAWRKSVRPSDQLSRTIGEHSEGKAYNRMQCRIVHRPSTAPLEYFHRMIAKASQSTWE